MSDTTPRIAVLLARGIPPAISSTILSASAVVLASYCKASGSELTETGSERSGKNVALPVAPAGMQSHPPFPAFRRNQIPRNEGSLSGTPVRLPAQMTFNVDPCWIEPAKTRSTLRENATVLPVWLGACPRNHFMSHMLCAYKTPTTSNCGYDMPILNTRTRS